MRKIWKYLLLLCLLSVYSVSIAQNSGPEVILTKIIDHAENYSLFRNNVDWVSIKKKMYALTKDVDSVPQLKPAIDLMLKELKDSHGRVFYDNQFLSYYSGEKKEHRKSMDPEIYNKIQSGQAFKFTTELIKDSIGYIRIVGLPMGDNLRMSSEIQNSVCELIQQGARSWIVDLRYNGGGNMFPMVEGITNIIGDGIVGGTWGLTKDESSLWRINDGDFFYDDQSVSLPEECKTTHLPKVAVLTSVYTASSGEAIAIILKNRPGTRFFGSRTMGMITATDWEQIDSRTAMSISVSYFKDREGNVYEQYVDVDEVIEFNPSDDLEKDKGVNRAIEWLSTKIKQP